MQDIYSNIERTRFELEFVQDIVTQAQQALAWRENFFRELDNGDIQPDSFDVTQTDTRTQFLIRDIRTLMYEVRAYTTANKRLIERYEKLLNITNR